MLPELTEIAAAAVSGGLGWIGPACFGALLIVTTFSRVILEVVRRRTLRMLLTEVKPGTILVDERGRRRRITIIGRRVDRANNDDLPLMVMIEGKIRDLP